MNPTYESVEFWNTVDLSRHHLLPTRGMMLRVVRQSQTEGDFISLSVNRYTLQNGTFPAQVHSNARMRSH